MSSIWLYNTNDVYLNSFCFGLRPTINVNPHFLGFSLRTPSTRKKFAVLAQGISRYNISKVKAMDIQLYLPSLEEQYKVGSLQRKLDNLIALYQRKINVLKSLKKFLLHNIFPQKDSQLPVLRFLNFNQKWEDAIFKDVIITNPTNFYTKDIDTNGEFPILQQGDQPVYGFSNEQPFKGYLDVVLFGDHTLSIYKPKKPFLVATDGIKIINSNLLTRDFLYYTLLKYKPKSEGYKRHFSLLKLKKIKFTTSVDEQVYISNLINTVNNSIHLLEIKFRNLNNLKITFLTKMFL